MIEIATGILIAILVLLVAAWAAIIAAGPDFREPGAGVLFFFATIGAAVWLLS